MKSGAINKSLLNNEINEISKEKLPINLNRCISLYEKNQFIKELLGEEIHYHYSAFYNFEYAEFNKEVNEWERERYFYQI
jgi:glutamine synthetase